MQTLQQLRVRSQNPPRILCCDRQRTENKPNWLQVPQKMSLQGRAGLLTLKVPKREIFVTELIILSHPIWIGDLRTKAKIDL